MSDNRWTAADVPDQRGRVAVVTGANTGLGFETAQALARAGAEVVLACRDETKAAAAVDRISAAVPQAKVRTVPLDLASLAAVRRAADQLRADYGRIDLLINNAGGMRARYAVTEDGFESTIATNHLGPFAFTGLLLDRLLPVPGSRIVTVSSIGHRRGVMNFDDLHFANGYRFAPAYFQSKLANLLFTYELNRRLDAAGAPTIAVAAHPGNARTEFGRDLNPVARVALSPRLKWLTSWFLQSQQMGALGTLRAATDPHATGGTYYGPPGRAQFTGYPTPVTSSPQSYNEDLQSRLWQQSEHLTKIHYAFTANQTA